MPLFNVSDNNRKSFVLNGVEFNEFHLSDKSVFDDIIHSLTHDKLIWEDSFEYLYPYAMSMTSHKMLWKLYKGYLMVFVWRPKLKSLYLHNGPIFKDPKCSYKEGYEFVLKILSRVNGKDNKICSCCLLLQKNVFDDVFDKEYMEKHKYKFWAEKSDFIYRCDDLIKLEGKAYKSRRHTVNKLKKDYQCSVRLLEDDPADIKAIMDVRNIWLDEKSKSKIDVWDKRIFQILFDSRRELQLRIVLAIVSGKVEGFCMLSKFCDNCINVLKECTTSTHYGLSEFLWYESLRLCRDLGEYENDGNGGSPEDGLYKYKLNHKPINLIEKNGLFVNKKGSFVSGRLIKKDEG